MSRRLEANAMNMKKMKVYTKTGDDGTTGLLSGERVHKHHLRVKAYGTIDELNAWLGLIRDLDKNQDNQQFLILIQKKLMILGAQLSLEKGAPSPRFLGAIETKDTEAIEHQIDEITQLVPPLSNFVIPGGHVLISYAHLARCVCRRAERFITELHENHHPVAPPIIAFINRLSDYLFMLSRKFAHDHQVEEVKWSPE